jgi:predicted transglutaminase-like cysteine proteinase
VKLSSQRETPAGIVVASSEGAMTRDKFLAAGVLTAGALMLASISAQASAPTEKTAYAQVRGDATPPIGWLQFCDSVENKSDCRVENLKPAVAALDERRWRELLTINANVNTSIKPLTDIDQWGVAERWSYPTTGLGDCEDYVLLKRKMLMEAGWPRQSLLITVVRDKKGDGHAVLTVKTDRGDFILDNNEKKVKIWLETGYQYIKRQSDENPNRWVSLGNIDTAVQTAQTR